MMSEKILLDPFVSRWLSHIEKIVVNFKQSSEL